MKIRVLFILMLGLIIPMRSQAEAAPYFTFTDEVRLAYQRALELRVNESSKQVMQILLIIYILKLK